jgi:hypothetical protein
MRFHSAAPIPRTMRVVSVRSDRHHAAAAADDKV